MSNKLKRFISEFKDTFITGLLVFIPLFATLYILWIGFGFIDSLLKPIVKIAIGDIPAISTILIVSIILIVGLIAKSGIGLKFIERFENTLLKIPIISGFYSTIKQTSEIFFEKKTGSGMVVLVEFPKKGTYSIGLTSGVILDELKKKTKKDVVNVYIPTTPNPTSGFLIMVPKDRIIPLKMSMNEAFKHILSGGLTKPLKKKK